MSKIFTTDQLAVPPGCLSPTVHTPVWTGAEIAP
jgi:hypothetical protein